MENVNEFEFIERIKNFFTRSKRNIKIGDVGIYKDVLTINTINKATHDLFFDYYVKVEVIAVYTNLVETKQLELICLNANNQELQSVIQAQIPKYLHPSQIQWQLKEQ